jgi:hypothetical protein
MIPFLNRNDEKWPHTRQIKIVGRMITFFHRWESIQKQREPAARYLFCKTLRFDYECSLFSG